jgi:ribosomal protein S18 acetylase RimI-like enzyme
MAQPFPVGPARTEELEPALRLVFRHLPEEARVTRVANALTLVCQGELDPQGIAVVRGRSGLLGAIVSIRLPGASGLVWPPQAVDGPSRVELEDALVRHARAWLRQGKVKVAQALVVPQEAHLAAPLERNGFRHITTLWYFRHGLEGAGLEERQARARLANLTFQTYHDRDRTLFQDTLKRTYQGTLDCPELNGVRTMDEIMDGHRGQGRHDPERWQLVLRGGRPVGVLLLTQMPEWDALDISYLGVVPEARGTGLGRALTLQALLEAQRAGVSQATLAVDRRNLPAWNMYLQMGFQPNEPREVFLAIESTRGSPGQ